MPRPSHISSVIISYKPCARRKNRISDESLSARPLSNVVNRADDCGLVRPMDGDVSLDSHLHDTSLADRRALHHMDESMDPFGPVRVREVDDTSNRIVSLQTDAEPMLCFINWHSRFIEVRSLVPIPESLGSDAVVKFEESHIDSAGCVCLSNCRSTSSKSPISHRVCQEALAITKDRLERAVPTESKGN